MENRNAREQSEDNNHVHITADCTCDCKFKEECIARMHNRIAPHISDLNIIIRQFCVGITSDRYLKLKRITDGEMKPEHRRPPLVLAAFMVPIGLV